MDPLHAGSYQQAVVPPFIHDIQVGPLSGAKQNFLLNLSILLIMLLYHTY